MHRIPGLVVVLLVTSAALPPSAGDRILRANAQREVIINWSWSTDVADAAAISTQVKATGVLLMVPSKYWDLLDPVQERVQTYHQQGFDVYLYFSSLDVHGAIIEPTQIKQLIALEDIKGIAVNFIGRYNVGEAESALIRLVEASKAAGKLRSEE